MYIESNKNQVLMNKLEFDQSRNDRLYDLKIPTYESSKNSVYYVFYLTQLVKNQSFHHLFRFNELKEYKEIFQKFKLELPEFPKKHFLRTTNKNPKMIKQRKEKLQRYFNFLINDPKIRGSKEIKEFIRKCKEGNKIRRALSAKRYTQATRESEIESTKQHQFAVYYQDYSPKYKKL